MVQNTVRSGQPSKVVRTKPAFSNTTKFALVFWIVNLAALRNFSEFLYLPIYAVTVLIVGAQFYRCDKVRRLDDCGRNFMVWVLLSSVGFVVSLVIISPTGASTGFIRFLFASPVFMALVLYTESMDEFRRHLTTAVVYFMVASMTLPLQFLTGPISWFATASERGGFERYSSLVGSLTSMGIVVGSYLIFLSAAKGAWRWLLLPLIVFPSLVSLSKSAIVNLVIALIVILYLNRRSLSKLVGIGFVVMILGILSFSQFDSVNGRVTSTLQSFGFQVGPRVTNYDVSVDASIRDRLTVLPKQNFEQLGDLKSPLVYAVGGGYGMASTALVPDADSIAPMAHNQYAELITVFGFLGGGVAIWVMISIGFALRRKTLGSNSIVYRALLFSYCLFLLNSAFANGTLYQPASASIFYIVFFAASSTVLSNQRNTVFLSPKDAEGAGY